jgi:YHS domain-containing protein
MVRFNPPRLSVAFAAISAAAVLVATLTAQSAAKAPYNSTRGVALDGYDVVAYFTTGRPTKGVAAYTHQWSGATWHFATAGHRDAFAKEPDKYAPQFGGFCAYGVSRGYAVDVDPDAWSIVDGRLYLNYSKRVQRTWNMDRDAHISKAEANWPAIAIKQSGKEE